MNTETSVCLHRMDYWAVGVIVNRIQGRLCVCEYVTISTAWTADHVVSIGSDPVKL
jgi:hypothetical protein